MPFVECLLLNVKRGKNAITIIAKCVLTNVSTFVLTIRTVNQINENKHEEKYTDRRDGE